MSKGMTGITVTVLFSAILLTIVSVDVFSYQIIEDVSEFSPERFVNIFDFESDQDKALIRKMNEKVEITKNKGYKSDKSLHCVMPEYSIEVDPWRSFYLTIPSDKPRNWSDFRYISFYVLNNTDEKQILGFRPSSAGTRYNRRLINPGRWEHQVYDLSVFGLQSTNNLEEVGSLGFESLLHIRRINSETEFFIDNIDLVKKSISDVKAIQLYILKPKFRGNIYSSNPIDSAKVGVLLDIAQEDYSNISGTIKVITSKGREIFSKPLKNTLKMQHFEFDISEQTELLDVQVIVKDNKLGEKYTRHKRIKRMPSYMEEVIFDENDNLLINGKPFFPVGVFCTVDKSMLGELKHIKENGFNCIGPYHFPKDYIIREAEDLGLKMLPNFTNMPFRKSQSEYDLYKFNTSNRQLAYYLYDEPHPWREETQFNELLSRCKEYKAADPYHPVIVLNNEDHELYAGTGDLMMVDSYTLPGSLRQLIRRLSAGINSMKNYGPVWFVPQMFTRWAYCRGISYDAGRPPNYDELRTQTWLGIALGAKGIFYYNYYTSLPDVIHRIAYPEVWNALGFINEELHLLTPVILSSDDVKVNLKSDSDEVRVVAKKYNDDLYIIAVNGALEHQSIKAEIKTMAFKSLYVLGENIKVDFGNNTIHDEFPPQITRIYTSNKNIAKKLNIESYRKKNAESLQQEKQQNRKNLAWINNGTALEASWEFPQSGEKNQYGYCKATPWLLMIDGNRGTKWTIGDDAFRGRYVWPKELIYEGERWLQLNLAETTKIEKINIVVSSNLNYQLQIWQKNDWKQIVKSKSSFSDEYHYETKARIDSYKLPNIETDKLRLLFQEKTEKDSAIFEIEAF